MLDYTDNPQALRVIEEVKNGENVVIVGKAGVGKTTLVKYLTSHVLH